MNLVATSEELKIIRFGGFMIKEHRDEREFGWKSTLIAPFWEVTLSVPHSILFTMFTYEIYKNIVNRPVNCHPLLNFSMNRVYLQATSNFGARLINQSTC